MKISLAFEGIIKSSALSSIDSVCSDLPVTRNLGTENIAVFEIDKRPPREVLVMVTWFRLQTLGGGIIMYCREFCVKLPTSVLLPLFVQQLTKCIHHSSEIHILSLVIGFLGIWISHKFQSCKAYIYFQIVMPFQVLLHTQLCLCIAKKKNTVGVLNAEDQWKW